MENSKRKLVEYAISNLMVLGCLLFLFCLVSCSTVATQSEDGRTLVIKGSGEATFENGAKIKGGTWLPELPQIELDT